jgi:hypothetical protein
LTDLSLERTTTGDEGLTMLAGLPNSNGSTCIGPVCDDALRHRDLPDCATPIGETRITDRGMPELGRLTELYYLGLRGIRSRTRGSPT